MGWLGLNFRIAPLSRLGLIVAALVAITTSPQAGHAGALMLNSERENIDLMAPPLATAPGLWLPRQGMNNLIGDSRPLDFEIVLENLVLPQQNSPGTTLWTQYAPDPVFGLHSLVATTSGLATEHIGSRPGAAESSRPWPATTDEVRGSPTIRDVLRSYVNVQRPSTPAGSAAGIRATKPIARPFGMPEFYDSPSPGFGLGLDIQRRILDLPADSLLGDFIATIFEPTVHLDGATTFSILGLGRFLAEQKADHGTFQVIDLNSNYSVFRASQNYNMSIPSVRAHARKNVSISITEFFWSMMHELLRTPIFYVVLLGTIGVAIVTRTKST